MTNTQTVERFGGLAAPMGIATLAEVVHARHVCSPRQRSHSSPA